MATSEQPPVSGDRWNRISKNNLIILFVLTLCLALIGSLLRIPGVIDHPQFTTAIDSNWLRDIIHGNSWYGLAYYGFFALDFIWALLLLWTLWKYVRKRMYFPKASWYLKILFYLFSMVVVLAYVFDATENIRYLRNFSYPEAMAGYKMAAYGVVVLTAILATIPYLYRRGLTDIWSFVKSAAFSLLILTVIGLFLPKAPQVNSIVVDLYEDPHNMIILFFVAPIYAITLVHYPSYFNINETYRNWYMAGRVWLFGTVFYKYNKAYANADENRKEGKVNFLFRILGIFFYVALFYLMAYTSEVNFDWGVDTSKISLALLALGIFWLYGLKKRKDDWYGKTYKYIQSRMPVLYDGDFTLGQKKAAAQTVDPESMNDELMRINKPVSEYILIFLFTIALHLFLFVWLLFQEEIRYTNFTAILSLLCIVFQMISFIYYRTLRSIFKFTFFNDKFRAVLNAFYILRKIEEIEYPGKEKWFTKAEAMDFINGFFADHDFIGEKRLFRLFSKLGLGAFSNNVTFLRTAIFLGLLNALFFIGINLFENWSLAFNPIVIILSALFLYYGFVVVLTKTFIYYQYSKEVDAQDNKFKFKFALVAGFLIFFVFNRMGRIFPNNLFTLDPIERNLKDEVSLESYVKALPKDQPRYYIGCYGGGMKANAWTMTALKYLYDNDPKLFEKTVGISGASGGTMGLINLSSIVNSNDARDWDHIIEQISTENILSLDLTHILGRDTFHHMLVPKWNLSGRDRSTKAMKRYAVLTKNVAQAKNKIPYRTYWKDLYTKHDSLYPILIANTTNVRGNQGMAVSVRTDHPVAENLLYNNADNILEINRSTYEGDIATGRKDYTLGYYDAASTSNRFPLISPAARIETKGHYNDGGIYENSGLLSVLKLFKAVNHLEGISDLSCLRQRNVFINIVNDKNLYIKERLAHLKCEVNKVNKNTEINAILSSVASTEMLPIYVKTEIKRLSGRYDSIQFETIYLPHRFTVADVKSIYGKELDCKFSISKTYKQLYSEVKENDSIIKYLVKNQKRNGRGAVIEPPMSRVMTDSAYQFMRRMLKHEFPTEAVKRIVAKK